MLVGYARVSTVEQDTNLQLDALTRAGCAVIWSEKTSSVGKRVELQKALASLAPGDKLVVYKLDRLARSLKDLLTIIERLERCGAGFQSLTEPIDTSSAAGRLMLQMLGAVAEFERSLIRERSIAGQRAARARGVTFGRPRRLTRSDEAQIVARYRLGGGTLQQFASEYNVSLSVVKRAVYRVLKPHSTSLL